ncbi:MAG: superoxide dismutase [Ni] [Verrucomicrobiota bacterium]
MKLTFAILLAAVVSVFSVQQASAHCQVPCGIYDDNNVIQSMHTDAVTIEKAMKQIAELSADTAANAQQLVRWTNNTESHAQAVQEKVLNYFLAQRLKVPADDADDAAKAAYAAKLGLCHQVIVTCMKCKQTTDTANAEKLHALLKDFQDHFGEKK